MEAAATNTIMDTYIYIHEITKNLADFQYPPDLFLKKGESPLPPSKFFMRIDDEDTVISVMASKILGYGGQKKALDIGNGKALLILNMDAKKRSHEFWKKGVETEVKVGNFVKKIGLLGTSPKKVSIWALDTQEPMPAILCDSFRELASNNIYLSEMKCPRTSTWNPDTGKNLMQRRGMRSLFKTPQEALVAANWLPLFNNEFIDDLARMQKGHIIFRGDSLSLAYITDEQKNLIALRPFGFDFSEEMLAEGKSYDSDTIKTTMQDYIWQFLYTEQISHELVGNKVPLSEFKQIAAELNVQCWETFLHRYPQEEN